MVTKVQKMLNSNRTADPFETWHKNRSSFKVVLFVIKMKKSLKIQKWTDFNGNGYLQGIRHAAPYGYHFGLLWWPFWTKNGRQNTKNPPIWGKFGFQVDYDVANWYPSFGSHIISHLVVFAPFLIMSPKQNFRRHIVFALFLIKSPSEVWRLFFLHCFLLLLSPQTKFGDLLFLHRFLLLLWTYVKNFDLTYIENCQRDFHKTWHIY